MSKNVAQGCPYVVRPIVVAVGVCDDGQSGEEITVSENRS
jgi:hypothetical protein